MRSIRAAPTLPTDLTDEALDGDDWEMIEGATSATYTPVADDDDESDVGRYLLAVVSYTDAKQNVVEDVFRTLPGTWPGWSRPIRWQRTRGTERRCSATRIPTPLARRTSLR